MHEWMTDQMVRPGQFRTQRIGSAKDLAYHVKLAAHRGQMDRLIVMGHGLSSGDSIIIGSDVVSSGTVSQYGNFFAQLRPYFSPQGYAHFENCFPRHPASSPSRPHPPRSPRFADCGSLIETPAPSATGPQYGE